jgi:hypothetical protein
LLAGEMTAVPADFMVTWWWSAALNLLLYESDSAFAHFDKAVKIVQEQGMTGLAAITVPFRGWALARLGHVEEGLSEMLQYRTAPNLTSAPVGPWAFAGLADTYLAKSRLHEGLDAVNEGLNLVLNTDARAFQAEMLRLKGELLLIGGIDTSVEAAQCFRDSINVARSRVLSLSSCGRRSASRVCSGNGASSKRRAQC